MGKITATPNIVEFRSFNIFDTLKTLKLPKTKTVKYTLPNGMVIYDEVLSKRIKPKQQ